MMNVYDIYRRDHVSAFTRSVDHLLNFQELSISEVSRLLHVPRQEVVHERFRLFELRLLRDAIEDPDNIANLDIDPTTWRVMRQSTGGETSITWFESRIQSDEEFLDRLNGIGLVRKYRIIEAIKKYREGDRIENIS